jgi:DTW domain-containing protein YfiP
MSDKEFMKDVPVVSLDDLVAGITNHNKLATAEARIKALEKAGDRLAFLMLNGTTTEMKKALWEWRELNPKKDDGINS